MKAYTLTFFLFFLLHAATCAASTNEKTLLPANTPSVRYVGRTLVSGQSVSYDWSGTYFTTLLYGGKLSARMSCKGDSYFNVFVDNRWHKTVQVCSSDTLIELVSGIDKKAHEVKVQKRSEGEFGRVTIHQFVLPKAGKLQAVSKTPERHIEFIGNSLTCGFGTEGKDKSEPFKVGTENCNLAYGAIISRYFDADYTFISHSGQGAVRNWGDSVRTSKVTMKERMMRTFDMDTLAWKEKSYRPQLVVINLGSNDFSTDAHPYRNEFVNGYLQIIKQIRELYGDVLILCVCPPTIEEPLPDYLKEIKIKANDDKLFVQYLPFGLYNQSSDLGSVYHPNYKGQLKMAHSLIPYISTITGWDITPGKLIE